MATGHHHCDCADCQALTEAAGAADELAAALTLQEMPPGPARTLRLWRQVPQPSPQKRGARTRAARKAGKKYYYEETLQKRWELGPGGREGNCDDCIEAEDRGWIDADEVYEGPMGPAFEPPLHPHCECEIETRMRRHRVYV